MNKEILIILNKKLDQLKQDRDIADKQKRRSWDLILCGEVATLEYAINIIENNTNV